MKFKDDESGQILIFTLLGMTVLCGFMALAIDVGLLFRAKRNVQIAADAAAVAGAIAYAYPATGVTATAAADNAAVANGVAAKYVTVSTDPGDGYHTGAGYIEVDISEPNATFFMGMINGGHSLNVGARSVAGTVPGTACIKITNPSGPSALTLHGSDKINSPGCGIVVDSTSSTALCTTGGASTINAPYLNVVGGKATGGKCGSTPNGAPVNTGALAQNDPFSSIVWPNPSALPSPCTSTILAATPTQAQLSAASGGVVCFSSANVTLSGVTLNGTTNGSSTNGTIYVFENGVTLGGTVTVTNGTIDNYQGSFNQLSTSNLTVTAPTAGTYNGIAIAQPTSNTTGTCNEPSLKVPAGLSCLQVQFGSSGSMSTTTPSCATVTAGSGLLCGVIYGPMSDVYLQDQGGSVGAGGVIAYDMFIKGTLNISSYSSANPSTTPLKSIQMVE